MSAGASAAARRTADALLEECGQTYAAEAGIRMRDTPQPLYRLLVLSHLLSARIRAPVAVAAARALFDRGMGTPRRMADATWQQRVDALGEGGYRRYDERTSTQLGEGAELVLDAWKGDLRRLRAEADGDGEALRAGLQRVPGIGPAGADIFVREVQGLWPETGFHVGAKGLQGAERVGLPASAAGLAEVARGRDPAVFAAALVRAALDKESAEAVREAARTRK
ncbi:endonuclease [Streptomyces sp. NPDC059698]|uniref:endonuclease n=1 Tax=unclassified Streptomyces TaxID=2593676 RepID=UPI00093DAA1D|nr:endonuclease [Streptomyces sp. CB02366]OKJ34249.1 endonuclease [Streptomyces sp. CB02366]WSS59075.1 endonuclease [Streptomyces sp. NBC_01178]